MYTRENQPSRRNRLTTGATRPTDKISPSRGEQLREPAIPRDLVWLIDPFPSIACANGILIALEQLMELSGAGRRDLSDELRMILTYESYTDRLMG